ESAIKTKLGIAKKDDLKWIEIAKYSATVAKNTESSNKVAVLVADGEIVDGEGKDGQIGGASFAKEVAKLRKDEKVKAIVL
ncbi:signal peptide peptidase SppA, partial [Vibrio parahaemolyticus]